MIGEDPKAKFLHHIDFRHTTTVSRDTHFTYWLCDYLDRFEEVLKKAGVYELIWASCYKQRIDKEILKALVAR